MVRTIRGRLVRRAFRWIAPAVIVLTGAPDRSVAQNRSILDTYAPPVQEGASLSPSSLEQRARQQRTQAEQAAMGLALEGALDPDVYTVGPNDIFSIAIGGVQPIQALVPVSSDGYLVITGIDRVPVAGRTLAAAQDTLGAVLRANFRNVPVNIALAQPRSFYVHVTGAVPEARRYLARPVSRVADVLEEAFLLEEAGPTVTNGVFRPALRNVTVLHRGGETEVVDLVSYYRAGRLEQNPYLLDGDAVHVPAFRPSRSGLFVDGEIPFAGTYDFSPGDDLLTLLRIGAGTADLSSVASVRLTRRLRDGRLESTTYRVADLLAPEAEPVLLQPLDNVHVPIADRYSGSATVEGAVRFPGTYAIEEQETTLQDLVEMAGGLREDALVSGAYLVRDEATDAREMTGQEAALRGSPYMLLTDTAAVQQDLRLSSLDYFGRSHLAMELLHQNRLSVDVEEALAGSAEPFFVPDGARLFVPRDEHMVRVLGQVVRPGGIRYMGPVTAEAYVDAAGGKGPRASGTYVLKAGSGQWLPGKKAAIESGDVIFVARKGDLPSNQELARLMLQRKDVQLRTVQVAFTAVSAFTAIVTTSLFILREIRN